MLIMVANVTAWMHSQPAMLIHCIERLYNLHCRTLRTNATARTGPLTAELKSQFESLPASKAEIEDTISQKNEEIDNIQLSNPRAMEEYNDRRSKIEKVRQALEDQMSNVQVHKEMIEQQKVRSRFRSQCIEIWFSAL